jgi:hypothetical protein
MGVLSREAAAATSSSGTSAGATAGTSAGAANANANATADRLDDAFDVGHEPVMFCVHDAKRGEVSILHGTNEVVVKDPQLVRRVLSAAARQNL